MINDPIEAVIRILKTNTDIQTLVGTRVFGLELPRSETASMPRKAIVVQPSGGGVFEVGSTDYVPHSDQRIDVFCYGETPYEAQKVRREVFDVLKNVRRQVINGVLVHWFQRSGGVLALRDPDTDWPVAFESWQMFFAERLVA